MTDRPQRVVLTRERERCRSWRTALAAAGVDVLELPLLRYRALPPPADLDPGAFDWILFTSPQGVRAFREAGLDAGDARIGVLGAGTAAELAAGGRRDDLGAREKDGAGLARAFAARTAAPASVLLPGPERRLPEPTASLEAAGFSVTTLPLYRTEPVPAAALPAAPFLGGDVVFFASPSAVRAFAAAYADRPACVAIGATTADAARAVGWNPAVAESPDLSAMARACGLGPLPEIPTAETRS